MSINTPKFRLIRTKDNPPDSEVLGVGRWGKTHLQGGLGSLLGSKHSRKGNRMAI